MGVADGRPDKQKPARNMLVEKPRLAAGVFEGGPKMRLDQLGEILGRLLGLQPVRTAIEPGRNPPHHAGIGIDRLVAVALQLQGP